MRVGVHLLILLLASSLAGMALVAAVVGEQSRLSARMEVVGGNALAMRDLTQLEESIRQLLISTDLIIGSGESYLSPGALRQADSVVQTLATLGEERLLAAAAVELESIERNVRSLRANVVRASELVQAVTERQAKLALLTESVDDAAERLLLDIEGLRSSAVAAAAADERLLQERLASLKGLTWAGGLAYVVLVLVLWLWASRRVSGPLAELASAARASMETGTPFRPAARGPAEIQQLSGQLAKLIGNLEDTVRDRTALLETNNEQLLAAAHEAEQSRLAAERANQARGEFLARMSHEIRTPLAGVLGVADLLHRQSLDATCRTYVDTIASSANALLSLINDILDFSRIDAGKLDLNVEEFGLEDLVADVSRLLGGRAVEKGLEFTVSVHPSCPRTLCGDRFRIRQVLINLLGNAIKFTELGGVSLTVHPDAGRMEASRIRLVFEVRDTGVGLDPEAMASIFDPFEQADGSSARQFGGTGLGLAISSEIAHLMGGNILVESTAGEGSVFRAVLPLNVAEGDEAAPVDAAQADVEVVAGADRVRVLVVEDNEVNRLIATTALRHLGFDVDVACDGIRAISAIQAGVADIVLMDCQMPTMDGFEATRRVREWEAKTGAPRLPIIALTANAFEADRRRCMDAGMDDFLSKPFTVATLRQLLLPYVERLCPSDQAGPSSAPSALPG